ncbi:glycosyltransferase [Candidatus Woesebacteria bacterium]|nr:MAG: glycosyltransferase [Candidatus Woesebacteria bacterium]
MPSTNMKIALVHDYIKEFGGAERVLKVLAEMYPKAPIYTAFCVKDSAAGKEFEGKEIKESFLAPILKIGKLYSPLRFLTPLIWRSMDLSKFDLVIASSSWYITRGFKVGKNTKVICYCHTPPRWLYGYDTSIELQKYWPVKVYAAVVGHFLRLYDFVSAQKPHEISKFKLPIFNPKSGVDIFIANSENVRKRIEKFYRRDAKVIYPPVDVENIKKHAMDSKKQGKYFLIVSRLVGAKGLEEAARAFKNIKNTELRIVGEKSGYSRVEDGLMKLAGGNIKLLGRLTDEKLYEQLAGAKGFIALARDEDFGMTVVEAMAAGTPVIAFNGGGFKESVVDGKTGILINDTDEETIKKAVEKLIKTKWDKRVIQKNAMMFSRERFVEEVEYLVKKTE